MLFGGFTGPSYTERSIIVASEVVGYVRIIGVGYAGLDFLEAGTRLLETSPAGDTARLTGLGHGDLLRVVDHITNSGL